MKVAEEILGKNRVRDLAICSDYIQGLTPQEIIDRRKLNLTVRRVEQIIYTNSPFVNPRIGWSKSKRLHKLARVAEKAGEALSDKKDILNVLEQMRKEIEGDKPINETHVHLDLARLHELADRYKDSQNETSDSRRSLVVD